MVMICYPLETVLDRLDPFAELFAPGPKCSNFLFPKKRWLDVGIPVAIPRNRTVNHVPWPSSARANRS
jgi:hypothetical protein